MLGGAIEKEQSFLKCNKIYQGAGHAAVGFWDPAARATEAAPWQALQQWVVGGWMGVGEGGLGLGHSCWCSCHTFSNKRELGSLPASTLGWERGKGRGYRAPAGLVPVVPKGDPEGWTDLPTHTTHTPLPPSSPSTPATAHHGCLLSPPHSLEVPTLLGSGRPIC